MNAVMSNQNEKASGAIWSLEPIHDMDDEQFQQWQHLLESRTGMTLPPNRKVFLQTNLGIRMREVGCKTYQEYYDQIVDGTKGVIEWTTLVDRLTVQETRFYRDPDAFRLVTDYLVTRPPEALQSSPLEIWSVGCSTGEEPYTLAMVVSEAMSSIGMSAYFGVTGTDISTPALEKAARGNYTARKLLTLDESMRDQYFDKQEDGRYTVVKSIRDRVCFSRVNILELGTAPMSDMNIIFCQNVLIYFRRWRRKEILEHLVERLAPGGLLVLGQGEMVDWHHPRLERLSGQSTLAFIKRSDKN